ncbi:hypothetical protein HOS95_gp06 [Salmonella phage vB_SpuP_Spp16]|uniref:Uncharacterized protein n=1 Tax=Salmonella phage vB_SpuP_Spp16 TaxID=2081603 RepID=A0A2P9JZT7_9CAUD|nr:hypothetical protein HOS95_gp06 [Salmonella phage vB_SpuP_Spp16]AVI05053.1 hypothetical protein [Salmonella phage vB_SpuP_Spp16]
MSVLKESLIAILKQSNRFDLCQSSEVECRGIDCDNCPLDTPESLNNMIKELEADND